MLGIDLYKEVLLRGKEYVGKRYKNNKGVVYIVKESGGNYSIFEEGMSVGVINKDMHKNGCFGIENFMLSELTEIKAEIKMSWKECLSNYVEESEKYYLKVIDIHGNIHKITNRYDLMTDAGIALKVDLFKKAKWYLCER